MSAVSHASWVGLVWLWVGLVGRARPRSHNPLCVAHAFRDGVEIVISRVALQSLALDELRDGVEQFSLGHLGALPPHL